MNTRAVLSPGLLALTLLLAASTAQAQQDQGGMGLDLSGSDSQSESTDTQESAEQAGIGLDISGDVAKTELLPRVVLLGLDTPERAGAAQSGRWIKALYGALRTTVAQALPGASIKDARERLTEDYATALRCAEASCLSGPAETLDADLLVTSRLALEDDGWTFRLWTFDRDRNKVETDSVTGRNPRDAKFIKASADLLAQRVRGLARPRAVLKVNVNIPQAVVRLGERTLGVGSLETKVAPGQGNLIVEADEFTPFAKTVSLPPGQTTTVEVYLQAANQVSDGPSEMVAEAARKSSGPTIFGRPALYTAVVGILAVGAGMVVGQGAKKIASRAPDTDGNGIANITRQERLDAQNQANLSTALVAGGAAVAGGSVLWLALVPTRSAPPPAEAPAVAPAGGSGTGTRSSLQLFLGGNF
ncbi:PEGA domain-containing protein [Hyalangium rubrum]|uniref:PEGA domain-containing protein n=1 Tax=Hyalangium rubrum TaxID=3103134 RepID=A0ABU5HJC7_9BACT|nr:PEGA domain-containing protein [Hyalangium sp. s54d21]MDY7232195.1 PEGA domain-containing protein [Hyalangium sp. s54d21]